MADISITAANVAKVAGANVANGVAGVTITAGQGVYLDATTSTIKLADSDQSTNSYASAACAGISLHAALAGQPIAYLTQGDITIGGTVVLGEVYVVSATAGGIAPVADFVTGMKTTIIGYGKSSTVITVGIVASGITHA